MINTVQRDDYFNTILSIPSLNEASINKAKEIFEKYAEQGVFIDCSFEDEVWKTTDEYSNVGLHFNFNMVAYKKYYEKVFCLSYEEFVTYSKVFIAITMGKNVLKTLQMALNDIKRIIRTDVDEIYGSNTDLAICAPKLCIDFISLLPEGDNADAVDRLVDALDSYCYADIGHNKHKQRSLAQFDSYFMFNDIMNDYWSGDIPEDERLFFYPLYLWWKITGVIPLRPREFILTERNCLSKQDDGYYLTLRRDNLKGSGKSVTYKLSDDYYRVTYKIPDKLAYEINQYLEFTKEYESTDIDTLFVSDTHYRKWGQKKHSNSRYLTYININTIMRYFFSEVIEQKYDMKVAYERDAGHLREREINYLHLGDTRHIALINIMAEGGTPLTAMLLAGHSDINMSAHYYSNLTNLIECRTYRQYRLITKGNVSYQVSVAHKFPVRLDNYAELSNGGRCYSVKYINGEIEDCLCAVGSKGEIGYCLNCCYYRNKSKSYFSTDSFYKQQIKQDVEHLSDSIKLVRQGKGSNEDIGEALIRLKSSSNTYQDYYNEKIAFSSMKGERIWEEESK